MTTAFAELPDASSFRRMAAAMWRNPQDPTIYGTMDVDVTETLQWIQRERERTGSKLSITHVVSWAVAQAFAQHPSLNAKVRYWGKLERRTSVDLFVSVATDGGKDLSGARIDAADQLSLEGWAQAVGRRASGIREGRDESFEKSRGLFKLLPWWLLRPLLRVIDVISNELHLHLPSQGMPRDPFGTAVITNVGTFGIDTAFAPFLPLGRCAMLMLLTEVKARPWVVDGKLEVRQVLRLCATFDHRIIDGFSAGVLAKEIRSRIEAPAGQLPVAAEAA
ncbi:MAG: 2-oxo acid dehydrogenase subunit E2 [Archangium sp.]|nr:2-oxo acid dehydrogenase subunit E2 [Archangium sp.]